MSFKKILLGLLVGGCLRVGENPPALVEQTFIIPADGSAPLFLDVPFPSDVYRDTDGTLIEIPGLDRLTSNSNINIIASAYSKMNGFGLTTGVFFPFNGDVDAQSITAASAGLVNMEIGSASFGELSPVSLRLDAPRRLLSVIPQSGAVLKEGTQYAAFIKKPLLDTRGREVVPSAQLAQALNEAPLQAAVDVLRAQNIIASSDELLGLTVYTTQSITRDLVSIREMLDNAQIIPAPQIQFPEASLIFDTQVELDALLGDARDVNGDEIIGRDQLGGVAHGVVGVVASGLFPSPRFQSDDEDNNDDEQFSYDADGLPVLFDGGGLIPIYVVLPDPQVAPMPVEGYPVIIWQHGFSSSRIEVWDFGNSLLARGFALVAIDAVTHGSRFPGSSDNNNNLTRPGFLGDTTLKDGLADNVEELAVQLAFFETLINLAGFRDNLRQTIVDLMALARLVREPSLDLSALAGPGSPFFGATIKLNPDKLFYYGESFGGIQGSTFVSIEPTIKGAVLNVPAAALLTDMFTGSAVIGGGLLPLLSALWSLPEEFRFVREDVFLQVAQGVLDGGDPMVYAPHALREPFTINGATSLKKHLLLFEVIGDELLANVSTEGLARAFGVSLMSPFYPGGPFHPSGDTLGIPICEVDLGECDGNFAGFTAVMLQESPATHGTNLSGHSGVLTFAPGFPFEDEFNLFPALSGPVTVRNPLEEGVAVIEEFFSDINAGLSTSLTHPTAPRADFDDDGADDGVDADPTNASVQ